MNLLSLHARRPRPGRGFRLVALFAVLMLAFGAAISATATHGDLPPASYSASVTTSTPRTPDTCDAEASCTLTFTISNASPPNSGSLIDTATIEAPTGFSNPGPGTVPANVNSVFPKTWTAEVSTDADEWTVTLTADDPTVFHGLAPSESVSVTLASTPSLATVGPDNQFDTTATGTLAGQQTAFHPTVEDPKITVVQEQVNCEPAPAPGCATGDVTVGNTTAQATASQGATQETLTLGVGGSFPVPDCGSSSFNAVGQAVSTNVTGADRSHVVTITLLKFQPNNSPGAPGLERVQICMSADKEFVTKSGPVPAKVGLLPDCPAVPVSKCIQSRSRNAGNTVIKYFVDPGDPIGLPGLDGI